MWVWFHKLGSPRYFWRFSDVMLPWVGVACLLAFAIGVPWALVFSPPDYQQGDTVRIMYIHVPCAIMSMMIYVVMAVAGAINLIWRMKLADIVAIASAPIGAWFTFLALVTGSLWGKPMWGTWWAWDARLTSELILLFLYLGYIALYNAIEDRRSAGRAAAVLALVGVVNIPIIHYSVEWWFTLHQGSTTKGMMVGGSIDPSMRWPLFIMMMGFGLFYAFTLLRRIRCEILDKERDSAWVKELAQTQ
jgi:heme exporter protein C